MRTILKISPNPSHTSATTFFTDHCIGFTSRAHSFVIARSRFNIGYKPHILKHGVLASNHRSRLHTSGCTDTNEFGSSKHYGKGGHESALENSEEMDRRNEVSVNNTNVVDFLHGSGQSDELSGRNHLGGANLDGNSAGSVDLGSESGSNGNNGSGSDKGEKIDRTSHLGGSLLDENSANLADFSDRLGGNCDCVVGNNENAIYGNGSDKENKIARRNLLGSSTLNENSGNLADFNGKASGDCGSGVGNDVDATYANMSETTVETDSKVGTGYPLKEKRDNIFETSANMGQSESEVIRKVVSPYSFDPLIGKKKKGLLSDEELEKLGILENFVYLHRFDHGRLVVKLMGTEHLGDTEELLTDSFAELMWGPLTYRPLLRFTVREHMMERRFFIPNAATLVGLYANREGEWMLGGTVELSFNSKGAAQFPPTPTPPKSSPYLCNMAVNKSLRRRGIGWHLLKASEKLVPQMGPSEIYLHCRMIDTAPFNMYTKAGYKVDQTDNILTLFTLQRRRHLMYKKLTVPS